MNTTKGWFRPIRALCRTMGKRQWRLSGDEDRIRTSINGVAACPLTQAAHDGLGKPMLSLRQWKEAADMLGLPFNVGYEVVRAADREPTLRPRMRSILLRAVRKTP